MKYDVFGIGNPIIDIIIRTEETLLGALDLSKGSMNLVDVDRQNYILNQHIDHKRFTAPGGSCPNTMVMISQLGGSSALAGKIGLDALGDDYHLQLIKAGVASFLKRKKGTTGSTIILVTPDADRTMNTHLGMCRHLAKEDLDWEAIRNSKYLYVTGYQWDTPSQKETVITAFEFAKSNNIKIAFSLSDLLCVDKHKKDFQHLLDSYVDLVFCNELEAHHMSDGDHPEDQIAKISEKVNHVVITLGKKGSLISRNGKLTHVDAFDINSIDTTGAGDAYAAGYLYAMTHGYSIVEAGKLASYCAAIVVSIDGPWFRGNSKEKVGEFLK